MLFHCIHLPKCVTDGEFEPFVPSNLTLLKVFCYVLKCFFPLVFTNMVVKEILVCKCFYHKIDKNNGIEIDYNLLNQGIQNIIDGLQRTHNKHLYLISVLQDLFKTC